MQDLQEVTQEVHYENYRSERLAKGAPVPPRRQMYVIEFYSSRRERIIHSFIYYTAQNLY